ncbi:hypothetical protein LIT25_18435 [Bacillus sp. F19]|nr:hypothetical protein LIT25_18435 [Bacillus sp. F19]
MNLPEEKIEFGLPKVVLSILSNDLDNHNYRVLFNRKPIIKVPDTEEYEAIRHSSFGSFVLPEIADNFDYPNSTFKDTVEAIKKLQAEIKELY